MRSRRDKLRLVQEFASRREAVGARAVATAVAELTDARRVLQELTDYRATYAVPESVRREWDASRWSDYGDFLERLNAAIAAQQDVIDQHQQRVNGLQSAWRELRSRRRSIDQLDQKLAATEQQRLDQLAQKEADERASLANKQFD
ncbi:MAG: flagellar export protein FliJ [Pseudomonadota bacterium]